MISRADKINLTFTGWQWSSPLARPSAMECVRTLHLITRMALKFTAGAIGKGSKWMHAVHVSMDRAFQALALYSLTEKPNDNEKGKYPAWRETTTPESSIDLPVETQMELGRCGDQDALTNLTRSINPQSDLNVSTESSEL